jgi:glycosyltransferase involved in cell wall biosynthesis
LRIPARKIRLINNAVPEMPAPTDARMAELRTLLGIGESDVIIGSVGRVEDNHKRFSDIIRALPMIRSAQPHARLIIVGDGPDRAMLEQLARDLGQSEAVIFAGYQSVPRDFYHLMRVFVLASAREAFGLVLVEAMLAGVPVVATEVGGIPFVLDAGKAGILVPPMQPDALAEAVLGLLADLPASNALRDAGLLRARMAFAAERYINEVADLYNDLLR